ncbi:MAG: thiamine-phosphate kinase [Rubritalea sp.]|uniref:thiamine-phosphate kinase n=1 Tax=Rubritalea sp. TaxID=2109375 RepID=UPI0032428B6E
MKLSDSSEDPLINRITDRLVQRDDVLVGPGDDCAVVTLPSGDLQLLKTDCVVEGVHYNPDENAERVGWKAIARVVSDIASMGGTPHAFVVTLVLTPDTAVEWLDALYIGMQKCAETFRLSIVGGETSSSPNGSANVISVAGTGHVHPSRLVLRCTGKVGDAIFVTGRLGGSLSGKHLDFTPRIQPAQWLVKNFKPNAMMDLSDGLAKDLPRMANTSGVSYAVDRSAIPCSDNCTITQALSDGEDYELLFTLSPELVGQLESDWPTDFPPLTRIGCIKDISHSPTQLEGGWEHFSDL